MVSMQPYSERYDFSYKYLPSLCKKVKEQKINPTTIFGVLSSHKNFSKTCELIRKANLGDYLTKDFYGIGYTIFVTEDSHLPESFMKTMDLYTSLMFINSYILEGIADTTYFLNNGSSVYITRTPENPILLIVNENKTIFVNQVGKLLYSIPTSNGIIHVLDNIAQVAYST